jgi:hypothetical protein
MKARNVFVSGAALLFASQVAVAGYSFERSVGEVQVLSDRVRIYVGTTYGTCEASEGWWGWSTSDPRHKDWLALVLFAKGTGRSIVVYDDQGSCSGPGGDIVGLERLYLK